MNVECRVIHPKPFTVSEQYARRLLAAWYEHNENSFLVQSASAPALNRNALLSGEQERLDLIQDLARSLMMCIQSGHQEDLTAALGVIHQLARWDGKTPHAVSNSSI